MIREKEYLYMRVKNNHVLPVTTTRRTYPKRSPLTAIIKKTVPQSEASVSFEKDMSYTGSLPSPITIGKE